MTDNTHQYTKPKNDSWWSGLGWWTLAFVVVGPVLSAALLLFMGGNPISPLIMIILNLCFVSIFSILFYKINRRALLLFWLTIILSIVWSR